MDVKVLKKSVFDKMLLQKPKKKIDEKNKNGKNNSTSRFLISIRVLGSTGPIRFIANKGDGVSDVINAALKLYALEERLPLLGSDVTSFLLYPANAGFDALNAAEAIGSQGVRNFVLCRNEKRPEMTEARSEMISPRRSDSWKAWFNKAWLRSRT